MLEQEFENVWLLKELPVDVREKLTLTKRDMGIDLVVQDKKGHYSAVQCKYKNPYKKGKVPGTTIIRREQVNFDELCTFLVLCERSGPWKTYIVMTNGTGIRRVGRRSTKDCSRCLKWFQKTSIDTWYKIAGMEGQTLKEKNDEDDTQEKNVDINEKRLQYFRENGISH